MYEEYYRLSGAPFRLNPDPKFFFGSSSHNKAMAYLHYGVRQAEGFIVITGEIGAGKSILIGHLLDQLNQSNVITAHLLTSNLDPSDLLSHVLSAFRILPEGAGKSGELEAFEEFLYDQLERGRRVLLVVDEAQNLPARTIEELRMLSNMDYEGTPLFQVFLVGQPEFREILAGQDMEQFRQRVIASYHLEPLSESETRNYIEHRLSVVGWRDDPVISADAFSLIHNEAGGVPRRINTLCNRLLLYCALEKLHEIDAATVALVAGELRGEGFDKQKDEADRPKPAGGEAKEPASEEDIPAVLSDEPAKDIRRAASGDGGNVVFAFGGDRSKGAAAPAEEKPKAKDAARAATAETSPLQESDKAGDEETEKTAAEMSEIAAAISSLSAFDRLRAIRESSPAREESGGASGDEDADDESVEPPQSATLSDVASAIAAIEDQQAGPGEKPSSSDEPLVAVKSDDWRGALAQTINGVRDELKIAHGKVNRLRRKLAGAESRHNDNREKIAARLARAEALLSDLRDIWR